ncbi:MAG: efflux RND transporter periplasmic adaptor subunit [Sphingobacteriaceae bacterium]|nr:efflux RND transporter periplasmic adaptor subunit [Sphingobacteriaceae bacterium]
MKKNTVVLAMTIVILASCHSVPGKKSREAVAVRTQEIKPVDLAVPVICSGMMTSKKEVRLSFKTGGIISHMYAEEGQHVQKGQLLATLNLTEVDAQLNQLQTTYKRVKQDYDRATNLLKDSVTSVERWENAESAVNMAKESLKIAKFNKRFSAIYATETGTIITKLANEGEIASPGNPVYLINSTNADDWIIRVGVSDKDWAKLRLGDKADITLDAYPGISFPGQISRIEQSADPRSGTFAIEIDVKAGSRKLASGLIGKVEISPSKSQTVYLLPIDALQEADEHGGNVFSLSSNQKKAVLHRVQIKYILRDMVAVTGRLENIKAVITQGVPYLTDKLPVEIHQN